MKTSLILTAAFLASLLPASAEVEVTMVELRKLGFLPQDKADLRLTDKIDIKRRNPFAERKKVVASRPTEQVETEESKIRTFFDKQKISGLMNLGGKFSVSLGRLTLEQGMTIPPVIPNQTQILRVMKVTDSELEIGWVEDSSLDTAVPRKISKKIDLRPQLELLIASDDNTGQDPQTYRMDDKGTVVLPRQGLFPNPSDIVDSLPPGSDTNPTAVLTEQERQELSAAAPGSAPPAPPKPEIVPDVPPPAEAPPPAPVENPEDSVQPDPDLADPAATPGKAAGPPSR